MERLSADDLLMLYSCDLGQSMDIGALIVLEGERLLGRDGRFQLEAARNVIEQRLQYVPRFRQVLHRPRFGLGTPLWVDAPNFDISDHVGMFPIVGPVTENQVLQACEELRSRPRDPSKPPWEMWFLTGMGDGRVGLFVKLCHAVADGIAGVGALAALLDLSPEESAPSQEPWLPAAPPSSWELLNDNVRLRLGRLNRKLGLLTHPIIAGRRARTLWPAFRELFAEERAPRTSLNRLIGQDRKLGIVRGNLDEYKDLAHTHNAKVNDVLLTGIAGGLRELLLSRGEKVDDLVLRAMVPVSLHQGGAGQGNESTGMAVHLPIGEADHVRRLKLIAGETNDRKKKRRETISFMFHSKFAQKALLRYFKRQRMANLYITNVPGPPVPLYFAGAPLLEVFPIVPIAGNMTLGIGALSYAGQFNITVIADRALCPDLAIFIQGVRTSLDALETSTLVNASSRTH
jgi:diacylglycerol O-acyltransferase / wax synthase